MRRLEAWFWTGPLGHLLGGVIDFSLLLGRALWARRAPRRKARGARRPSV